MTIDSVIDCSLENTVHGHKVVSSITLFNYKDTFLLVYVEI